MNYSFWIFWKVCCLSLLLTLLLSVESLVGKLGPKVRQPRITPPFPGDAFTSFTVMKGGGIMEEEGERGWMPPPELSSSSSSLMGLSPCSRWLYSSLAPVYCLS